MDSDASLDRAAATVTEEILRRIYGDDFAGCTVSFESLSGVVRHALDEETSAKRQLLELYEKAFEATFLLASPPADGAALTPPELQSLLGERLDAIRTLARKILDTSDAVRQAAAQSDELQPEELPPHEPK